MPNASVAGRVWRPVMIVIAIWVVALLIAWPVGNFPIDDDFSHSGPVRAMLVDGGRFEMPWFSAMTLVTHVLWAT
ncbi:MAG: hypothetical protein KAY59_06900, partial [Acidobacteria bacterium]|nr:hypothetical protein [Acidobacteriota bacterium]